MKNKMKQT